MPNEWPELFCLMVKNPAEAQNCHICLLNNGFCVWLCGCRSSLLESRHPKIKTNTYVWNTRFCHVAVQVSNFLVIFVTIATELEPKGPIGR